VTRGVIPSPNIWDHPDAYELENRSVDPDGVLETAMRAVRDWAGLRVLDIGCGTGFHLPVFSRTAASVIGVEPHSPLVEPARRRVAPLPNVEVRQGVAQSLPVPDASVDIAHARWAYFFGPGCEPGLAELERVMAPGGVAYLIDNDATRSTFGRWFRRALPAYDPARVQRFWDDQGFTTVPLLIRWQMTSRADFERVVRIEFTPRLARSILRDHPKTAVDYAVALRWREY
jgi:SAM-dependent methyltransferase